MARRIRAYDWAATPLGPAENWPQSLKTAVDLMLASGHAMQLAWGPERTVLYNDAYAPMLGERHPSALGLPFRKAWPDIWREIEPLVERAFAGETVRFEDMPLVMTRHGHPEYTWWNFSYSPVRDESGAVAGLLNVTMDATAKVHADRADAALRESEKRYHALFAGSPVPFMVLAPNPPDFTITAANKAYFAATLTTPESLIGRRLFDVFPDDPSRPGQLGSEALAISLDRVMTTRRTDAMERVRYDIVTPSGGFEPHWWLAINAPMLDASGEITAIIHQVDRQTKLHLAEEAERRAQNALRESECFSRALVEGVPQLVWRASEDGNWTWASPQWAEFTGQSEQASLGVGWLHAVDPDDRDTCRSAWREAQTSGSLRVEHRLKFAAQDRYHWVQTQARPVRDKQGGIIEWLGTTTDVEDMHQAHEQSILVAELQHRTRNLLTIVSAIADQTLATSDSLPDFSARFDQRLAALGRVQSLMSRYAQPDVTTRELIEMELAAHGVDGASNRVQLSGPPIVIPTPSVAMFALALHELMTNSTKYGALRQDGGRLSISWREQRNGNGARLHLAWRESGLSIPADAAQRRRGFGLGLIETTLPYEMQGNTELKFTDDGVSCTMELQL
ncbi:MAG: PAS domain-containing protein [Methylobacteriaceae bacterium]|nr:PAS domain-containing protein [Methylobacteriaceae bacterium]